MTDDARSEPKWMHRTGLALTGLVSLFMLMDATMKLLRLPIVLETTAQLGWPVDSAEPLGVILLIATALCVLPRTSVLGAILLTGYVGGAVATRAPIGSSVFSDLLFGVYLGILMWAGLDLRDSRVRALLPLRAD